MIASRLRVIARCLGGMPPGRDHASRLAGFYAPQAEGYDASRERVLHGRRELIERLPAPPGGRVVELGAGTGRNLLFFGERLDALEHATLVDLCAPLLDRARERFAGRSNVRIVEADATTWRPAAPVDCVYFSYALTMIPDWRAALRNAISMLRPGGTLGVVDFYLPPSGPAPGRPRSGTIARAFWPRWFARDGVGVSEAHLPALEASLRTIHRIESAGPVPCLPGLRVPYYLFVGRRPG